MERDRVGACKIIADRGMSLVEIIPMIIYSR